MIEALIGFAAIFGLALLRVPLAFSMGLVGLTGIGLTRGDRLRFLRGYFQRPLRDILHDEARLLAWLQRKAERLSSRYARRYAPGAQA